MMLVNRKQEGYVLQSQVSKAEVCQVDKRQLQMVKRIGAGSFGETWEAIYRDTTPIAVKIRNFDPHLEKISHSEWLTEVATMSTLLHMNITRMFAVCLDQRQIYLIVESTKQGSLLEYLRGDGRSLKLPQLIDKAAQIASGMDYLE